LNRSINLLYFKQLVSALRYIHKQGLLHKDIKPSNVFLDEQRHSLKLGDFGFQKSPDPLKLADKETRLFQPADCKITEKSDVYALGVLLFELCNVFKSKEERNQAIEALKLKRTLP